MAVCFIEGELLPMEVLHCGNGIFDFIFAPVTLTLLKVTFMTCIPWIPVLQLINSLLQGFRKLSSDRQTDKQDRN